MTKRNQNNLIKALSASQNEKDVENSWREWFNSIFNSQISSPYGTDGVIDTPLFSSLLEFKFDKNLSSNLDCAKILIQAIFYLKRFQEAGKPIPKSIFVGDINECFVIETKAIVRYLQYDLDWSIAPSSAAINNTEVVMELAKDENISPFIYNVNENFDGLQVIQKIANITTDKPVAIPITSKNIIEIFIQFKKVVFANSVKKIFKTKADEDAEKDLVDIFFKSLIQSDDVYIHPRKNNVLCTPNGEIKVDARAFRAFFSSFRQNYSPSELEDLTANKDRILEEEHRRRTGAFFTPQIWVDYAHKMISEQFGYDWKEKYIVWDCCCGTANLTRGYKFSNLFLSTIEQHDIDIIKSCGYNQEAIIFQYDFLSEVGFNGIPEKLRIALEEGRVIVLMNPPYGTANNMGTKEGDSKAGIAKNIVNDKMKEENIGSASQQLYAQFLWKLWQNNIIKVATFAPPLFMTGPSFDEFRSKILKGSEFKDGIIFQASNFADVKSQWGISFTIWSHHFANLYDYVREFNLKIADIDIENFKIKIIGNKTMKCASRSMASAWIREEVKGMKTFDAPQMKSSIGVKQNGCLRGKLTKEFLGYFLSLANNVYTNVTDVSIFSSCAAQANGISIIKENIHKVVALFTARKTITPNWLNCKDEYSAPNEDHIEYKQWNNDCFVYALFQSSSNQSSLRQVEYKDKKWDILNHFFFMSHNEMMQLADENLFNEMYQDAKTGEDRYIFKILESINLSEDAREVLNHARHLVRKSMYVRKLYYQEHPEYHLHAWDAGWAQIKPMLKEYYPEIYKEFVKRFKKFEKRMSEGVYKFGFLAE